MALPESEFPTIQDVRDLLSALIDQGFGDLPAQILVVPDSTIQAIARLGGNEKPAKMIEFAAGNSRLPVCLISTERLSGGGGMGSTIAN